jgi:hypothetical protein
MSLMLRVAVVVTSILLLPPVQAEDPRTLSPTEIISLVGIDQNLLALGSQVKDSLRASGQVKDEAFLTYWETLAQTMFDPDDLVDRVAEGLDGKFAATELSDIKTFYSSGLGLRMTEVENAAIARSLAENEAKVSQGRQLLSAASETRKALLQKMAAMSNSETSKAASRQAFRALMLGIYVGQNRGSDVAVPWGEIESQLDALIPMLEKVAEGDRMPRAAFVYRQVTDDDLAAYLEFFDSEVGRKFYSVVGDVLAVVEGDEVVRFGTALAAHSDTLAV